MLISTASILQILILEKDFLNIYINAALIKVTTMRRDEQPREAGSRGRRGGSGIGSIGFGGQQVVAMVLLAAVDEDEGSCSGVGVGGAVVGGVAVAAAACCFVGGEYSIKVGGD